MAHEMILIPRAKYESLISKSHEDEQSGSNQPQSPMCGRDADIQSSIISPPSIPERQHNTTSSETQHKTAVSDQQYHTTQPDDESKSPDNISATSYDSDGNLDDRQYAEYNANDVLRSFKSTDLNYITQLIEACKNNQDILYWDLNSGEIFYMENRIEGSNISELLQDSLTDNLNPVAKMHFYGALAKLNIPVKCIKHQKNKELLKALLKTKKNPEEKRM